MKTFTVAVFAVWVLTVGAQGDEQRFTEEDLPALANDPNGPSEIDDFARSRGFRYARDTRRAARGDFKALKKFFEINRSPTG